MSRIVGVNNLSTRSGLGPSHILHFPSLIERRLGAQIDMLSTARPVYRFGDMLNPRACRSHVMIDRLQINRKTAPRPTAHHCRYASSSVGRPRQQIAERPPQLPPRQKHPSCLRYSEGPKIRRRYWVPVPDQAWSPGWDPGWDPGWKTLECHR